MRWAVLAALAAAVTVALVAAFGWLVTLAVWQSAAAVVLIVYTVRIYRSGPGRGETR